VREIVLDTETTGLSPKDGHRVVEIAAVELIHRNRTGNAFHCYINPERNMPPEAEKIHGLSESFLKQHPTFDHHATQFLEFIQDAQLVIHNATFDMGFLNFELQALGYPMLKNPVIDTLRLAKKRFPGSPASLDALCRRFQIDRSQRIKHGALIDTHLLVDVYIELSGGKQSTLSFLNMDDSLTSLDHQNLDIKGGVAIQIPTKSQPPKPNELQTHQEWIQKISHALWRKHLL
jgi:DNA polymerase-3 subunit epsilon